VQHLLLSARARPPEAPRHNVRRDGRLALWRRPHVAPVAQLYRTWRVWDGAGLEATAAADALREGVLLVAPPAVPPGYGPPIARATAPPVIEARRTGPDRWRIELDGGTESGIAFLSEGYHPWWQAMVDGVRAPVWRASVAHLAVAVTPGQHTVELYLARPVSVAAADAITAAAWVAMVAAAAIMVFRSLLR
jgi:hypothetical protein